METITNILSVFGIPIGGLITWYYARFYYMQASRELLEESKRLKDTSDLILYMLQYPNAKTELKRNEKGEVTGLIVNMEAKL